MRVLITGGAGFIGKQTASHFLRLGYDTTIIDNLSRPGSRYNLKSLQSDHPQVSFKLADICDYAQIENIFLDHGSFDAIIHLAAQVAVTTSVTDPRTDFNTNALGTFNLLEAYRLHSPSATFIYSSTNKVYGALEDLRLEETATRYQTPASLEPGLNEQRALDFHSPYGCSKGAADQYVHDYSRIYGLNTCVFRQSCIYGTEQFGVEDQGWVAWFAIATLLKKNLTIYGNGKQVRDLLWIDDLIELYGLAIQNIDKVRGQAFNVGGGPSNAVSVLEVINTLKELTGNQINCTFQDWRPGDQAYFVADTRVLQQKLGWTLKTDVPTGLSRLLDWIGKSKDIIESVNSERLAMS